jgi:hypothetical protein
MEEYCLDRFRVFVPDTELEDISKEERGLVEEDQGVREGHSPKTSRRATEGAGVVAFHP